MADDGVYKSDMAWHDLHVDKVAWGFDLGMNNKINYEFWI